MSSNQRDVAWNFTAVHFGMEYVGDTLQTL